MSETLHIYTRVSTAVQADGTSLSSQAEAGEEYANRRGFEAKVWNEGGQSSAKEDLANRPVLQELLDEVKRGNVKHLYVWNTDRLSRNMETWGMIRLILIRNNVHLHTPTGEQILTDPQTNLMLGILSEFSQYDNQIRAERSRIGKLKRVKDGRWMGGPTPYGYMVDDQGKLAVNKEEAKWVKKIFSLYESGKSIDHIRTELMKNGVVTRRKNAVWSHGSINKLLSNTHFVGHYYFKDKKTDGRVRISCPTIISASTHKKVEKLMKSRSYKTGEGRTTSPVKKHEYLMTGLLRCGDCGSKMHGNHKETQTSYYMCSTKTNKYKTKGTHAYIECGAKKNVHISLADKVVWETVFGVVSQSFLFKEDFKNGVLSKKSKSKSDANMRAIQVKIKNTKSDLEKIRSSIINFQVERIAGLVDAKDVGDIIERLDKRAIECEAKIEDMEKELIEEKKDQKWIDWVGKYQGRLDELNSPNASIVDKREFLHGVLEKIEVLPLDSKRHQLKINFKKGLVGDGFKYRDPKNKKKGYILTEGQRTLDAEAVLPSKKKID